MKQKNPMISSGGESVHANIFRKLWENPNPTSMFAAQNIELSSGDYDFLLFVVRAGAGSNRQFSEITSKGCGIVMSYTVDKHMRSRLAEYTNDTKYAVADAISSTIGGGTSETNNLACIPVAVYGFDKSVDITAIVSNVSTDATKCIMSDGITSVETAITKNNLGTSIDLTSYNSASNKYTFPSDGYVRLYADTNGSSTYASIAIFLYGADESNMTYANTQSIPRSGGNGTSLVFVKKGMKAYFAKGGTAPANAGFWPLQ